MKQSVKGQSGFSLIEVLVSMALLSIIMIIAVNILVTIVRASKTVSCQSSATQEAQNAVERLRRVIRSSDSLTVNAVSGTLVSGRSASQNFSFTFSETVAGSGKWILSEGGSSVVTNEFYFAQIGSTKFLSPIIVDGNTVGVIITFQLNSVSDTLGACGTVISTQITSRNLLLK